MIARTHLNVTVYVHCAFMGYSCRLRNWVYGCCQHVSTLKLDWIVKNGNHWKTRVVYETSRDHRCLCKVTMLHLLHPEGTHMFFSKFICLMLVCIFFGMIPMKDKYTPVWRQTSPIIIYYCYYSVVSLAFVSFHSNCNSGTALLICSCNGHCGL